MDRLPDIVANFSFSLNVIRYRTEGVVKESAPRMRSESLNGATNVPFKLTSADY